MLRSSLVSSLALVLLASVAACGLRSDPFATTDSFGPADDDGDDDGNDDPNRQWTCNNPFQLPTTPGTFQGTLSGPSYQEGWCGADGGPEDVYTFVPEYDIDVILYNDPAVTDDDLVPTLRVIEGGCASNEGFTKICTGQLVNEPFHFLAREGQAYSVIVDSRTGTEGTYGLRVDYGFPTLEQCNVHPEVIEQLSGSAFIWNNEFSQGQGRVDGYCGGPGRDNMFLLRATYPGLILVQVDSTGGFAPVISVRTECAALSELECVAEPAGGTAFLEFYIPEPGDYYVVVDQAQLGSGSYELRVDFID